MMPSAAPRARHRAGTYVDSIMASEKELSLDRHGRTEADGFIGTVR
jgi:hypothetical protein